MSRLSPSFLTRSLAAAATLLVVASLATAEQLAAQGDAVALAVSMLNEGDRGSAKVIQDQGGEWVTLRDGSGAFVCIADTPGDDSFRATCYHKSLDPYMARGRELAAQGVERGENISTRVAEIASGKIKMPTMGTLIQVNAPGDWSGDAAAANRRTVLYVPGATAEEVGLPTGRSDGPWFMASPVAHIMISG